MKRAQSRMILSFLRDLEAGNIAGRENSSGPITLQEIETAFRAILAGESVDEVLKIERAPGPPTNWETIALACHIHNRRKAGEKWAVIEVEANQFLESAGGKPVTMARLRKIYRDHREWIECRESVVAMCELVAARLPER